MFRLVIHADGNFVDTKRLDVKHRRCGFVLLSFNLNTVVMIKITKVAVLVNTWLSERDADSNNTYGYAR
jgi:hypothetical protein